MRIRSCMTVAGTALALSLGAAQAQDNQQRMTGLQLSGDGPIQIESDRLEVREEEGIAIFTGSVEVVQGDTLMRSGKMTVYYASDGEGAGPTTGSADIERLEVEEKVYLRSETQTATGDRGTFDMRTEVMELTGEEVVLTEGENVIVGCRLTVQMATGLANLEGCGNDQGRGRVRMLLQPGSQNR